MMAKAQSVVIQFLLFFLIGFALFISIGSFFKYQSDLFRQTIASSGLNLTSSYLTSAIIAMNSCKQCDFVNLTLSVYNTTAGYPIIIMVVNSKLNISSLAGFVESSSHNLLSYTLRARGSSSSSKPIILTFNKNNNILEVG
jgi:hypothetical protein